MPQETIEPAMDIGDILPDDLNDAVVAGKLVAHMPIVSSAAVRQEIRLRGAIVRAGIGEVRRDWHGAIVILPPETSLPERLGLERRELLLRVLATVADVPGPIAWAAAPGTTAPGVERGVDRIPSCQLEARVIARTPESAAAEAEIIARLPNGQGWRQHLQATWDGLDWVVKTAGLRLSW